MLKMFDYIYTILLCLIALLGCDYATMNRLFVTYQSTHYKDSFPERPKYFSPRVLFIFISSIIASTSIILRNRGYDHDITFAIMIVSSIVFLVSYAVGFIKIRNLFKDFQ